MKTHLTLGAAVAVLLSAAPAFAQTAFDGFYVGAGGGGQNSRRTLDVAVTSPSAGVAPSLTSYARSTSESFMGHAKVFGGYNMTFDRWLVGGEVGYQPDFGNERSAFLGNVITGGPSSGTYAVTARLGYLVQPDLMLYGFGGWAGQQQELFLRSTGAKATRFATGFTAGVGLEYAINANLFLRGEAQYTAIDTRAGYAFSNGGTSYAVGRNAVTRYGATVSVGYRF